LAAKKVAFWVALLALAVLFASPALADRQELERKIKETQKRLNQIQQEMRRTQQLLKESERRREATFSEIQRLDRDIDRREAELAALEEDLRRTRARIAELESLLEEGRRQLERRKDLLEKRLQALYEGGTVTYLEVLLSSRDFAEFLTTWDHLQRIFEQDVGLLREVQAYVELVKERKREQEELKARLEEQKAEVQAAKVGLEARREEREALLRDIQSDIEAYRQMMDRLEEQSAEAKRLLQRYQAQLEAELRREGAVLLSRPVFGPITSPYGMRFHPILGGYRKHNGTDYGVPYGTPVKAADYGEVMLADWFGAYGKTVILVHGRGISTLYAHLSSIAVTQGQKVQKGQVIGYVGSTGLSTGPHLHFEVRINGEPVDPEAYLDRPLQ
jgi:murein DD-endopeptidase MepM/ murein hydrolase activator NlpD